MGKESNIRKRLIVLLKSLDAIPVENPARPGTPDVEYKYGWIELKQVEKWPVRGGPLRMPHFTPQQRIRHRKRRAVGGLSFVLTRVGTDWFLLNGEVAAEYLGVSNKLTLEMLSIFFWDGGLDEKALLQYLTVTHAS